MFHFDLLIEERRSPRTLQYWIDYLVKFGASHKVPAYDKLSLMAMYNLDIYFGAIALVMLLVLLL